MTDPIELYFLEVDSLSERRYSAAVFADILGIAPPETPKYVRPPDSEKKYPDFHVGCKYCRYMGTRSLNDEDYDLYYCTSFKTPMATNGKRSIDGAVRSDEILSLRVALVLAGLSKFIDIDAVHKGTKKTPREIAVELGGLHAVARPDFRVSVQEQP